MTTRHPPTSSLHLQHQLHLQLVDESLGNTIPEGEGSFVANTDVLLTIAYHWEVTDNGHPTPNSPAWNPIAAHNQFWVPVFDHILLGPEDPLTIFADELNETHPTILRLLSTLSPSDFPLPPIPPLG